MTSEDADLLRLHAVWFEAERERRSVIDQFVSVGWVDPGLPIPDPERALDDDGIEQLRETELRTGRAREAYNEALEKLTGAE